jgi:hypothetical protein
MTKPLGEINVSLWRVTGLFSCIGIVVPIAFLVIDRVSPHGWSPSWIRYLWPTDYMLIATNAVVDVYFYKILTISIGSNAFLYGCIGCIVSLASGMLSVLRRRSPDSTL